MGTRDRPAKRDKLEVGVHAGQVTRRPRRPQSDRGGALRPRRVANARSFAQSARYFFGSATT